MIRGTTTMVDAAREVVWSDADWVKSKMTVHTSFESHSHGS
jgi:hypothetical protein